MARARPLCFAAAAVAALAIVSPCFAAPPSSAAPSASPAAPVAASIVVLPTAIAADGSLRAPRESDGELARLAQSLDVLLADTAQDLGLSVVPAPSDARRFSDGALIDHARAALALVVLPSLRAESNGDVDLRLTIASPSNGTVESHHERVRRGELSLRAVVLLRDLVAQRGRVAEAHPPAAAAPSKAPSLVGRITLMTHATAFGGLVGFSIQRGSGSDDPRLLFPLLFVGAGIGLGASYLAANEWDVDAGDAWYFAAGAWWPTLAGHLLYQGRFSATRPESDRWVFGVLGGGVGVTVATLGLALQTQDGGGALIAHSGGAFGLAFGALAEFAARGDVHVVPFSGMGYGAGLGWLVAAAVATQVRATPMRVLAIDGGAALAGLVGAALAGPLLLNDPSADRQRAWVGITAASALAGGIAAAIVLRPSPHAKPLAGTPLLGVIGESRAGALSAPIFGIGYAGSLGAL